MAARVLFALMTADAPGLTATQLAARLEVSPAAISGAVRYLGQIGFVVREPVPGSRRDHYRLRDHTWYAGTATAVQFYDVVISAADELLGSLGSAHSTAAERVAEMRDFFAFVRSRVPGLLDEWQASRAAPLQSGS
ncbi:MarR family transcriptional regulator [Actinocrinis puniceicyclus]|uniref:MarR family transcriptional regulator n=2 Tax=Actinocrinis puniceicyclus TaxID=977794 RepID=A0A8J8BCX1_9ACTN|nr:MarR family transcriptional regulator [Actinocrinis puniceicyclus]